MTREEYISLRQQIEGCWSYDTSFLDYDNFLGKTGEESWKFGIDYDEKDKAYYQCGTTAVYLYRKFGGRLLQGTVEGEPHYFNEIDGHVVDFTWRQFDAGTEITDIHEIKEKDILANSWFIQRYYNFSRKMGGSYLSEIENYEQKSS